MMEFRRGRVVNKICGYLKEQQEIAINLTEMIHLAEEGLQYGDIAKTEELKDYLFLLADTFQVRENSFNQALREFREEVSMATRAETVPVTTGI